MQIHPIGQEFFSHNYGLTAKFSHNLGLGILGLKSSYRQTLLHKRAKTFCDLRSFSLELSETLIPHIRQESQVVREMSPSLKLQETAHDNQIVD